MKPNKSGHGKHSHGEHLDGDAIQALLDAGGGPAAATGPVCEHLEKCVGCRVRADAWREVFQELGQLRRFVPPGRLAERVMSGIEVPRRTARSSAAWSWLRRRLGRPAAAVHVSGGRLQDLADGTISRRRAARAKTHLETCARCGSEYEGWLRLMAALESLPSPAPPPGFADGVMARWSRSAAETAARSGTRRARRLRPRGPRGWACAGAVTGLPAVAFAGAAAFVQSFPQFTVGGLATYLWWRAGDALSAFGSSVLGALMGSGMALRAYALADYLLGAPGTVVAGAAAFTTLTLASVWVLQNNLGAARTTSRHVHV